jgi:hypothetical protein
MKFSNMNNNSRSKFQKYESAFDRKAKKAEQLRFRNTRERMELNSRSEEDYDEYEDDDNQEENLE